MASSELQALVQQLRSRPIAEEGVSIEQMRAGYEEMAKAMPVPEDVRREPVMAGTVLAEWIAAPGAADDRVILYLHGGGYVIGSINTHRDLVARLSRAAG